MTFAEYRAIDALNNTGMGYLKRSPAHYQAWLQSPEEEDTEALRIGKLAHMSILEPEKFAAYKFSFAIKPEGMKFNTKEGKEWRDAAQSDGFTIVSPDEHALLFGSVDRIAANPVASQMLGSATGQAEVTLVAELYGCPVKARLDWLTGGNTIVDVKTCLDASPDGFSKAIADRSYHRQAAFYIDIARALGHPVEHFCFLALEKSHPFEIACYQLDQDAIELGRAEYIPLLDLYSACRSTGHWPGYSQNLQVISLPPWKMKGKTL